METARIKVIGISGGGNNVVNRMIKSGFGFVTFISGVISHVMLGYTVVVVVLAYFLLFSGFFINRDQIPPFWIWFHYLSLVKYPYEGVLQNEFNHPSRCFSMGAQMFDNTPLKGLSDDMKAGLLKALNGSLGLNVTMTTCVTKGSDILKDQSITQLSKWDCFWVTVAWGFLFRLMFYIPFLLGSKNKRR